MDGHAFVRRQPRVKIKGGGVAVGCECRAMTFVPNMAAGIRWHHEHVRTVSAPAPSVDELQARLDGLLAGADALIGG